MSADGNAVECAVVFRNKVVSALRHAASDIIVFLIIHICSLLLDSVAKLITAALK